MRILLIEDDQMLGKAVKNALASSYDVVDWMTDFDSAQSALKTAEFDVVLLDINLPDGSGLELLKNLRLKKSKTPVIILTARDAVLQRVEGLDLGADDYLPKPFDLDELLARIRSVVRRSQGIADNVLQVADVALNPIAHVVNQGERKVDLSPKEFSILKILLENIGKVVSRHRLEDSLYSWDDSLESNAVEVHIHHLRKKLGTSLIKTVRGVGYTIEKS
jgi:two-component system response regulator QseB